MSLETIRRLVKETRGKQKDGQFAPTTVDDLEQPSVDTNKNDKINRFVMFDEGEEEEADDKTPSDIEETEENGNIGRKRTKKKKKKTSCKPSANQKPRQDDELENILNESPCASASDGKVNDEIILFIDAKYLNFEIEQKKSLVSRSAFDYSALNEPRKAGKSKLSIRKHLFMNAKTWPTLNRDLISMEIESKNEETIVFRFTHSTKYQEMQEQFRSCLEKGDAGEMVALLNLYPNHIETLVQFSDILLLEDNKVAGQLIERAVCCFESILHPRFNLSLGSSRLDYRRPENRIFYNVLFRHLCQMEGRGFNRTALEISKLIFSFDPVGDPLAVIFAIDSLALKAGQYDFLLSFYEMHRDRLKLHHLPNYAFSRPLCLFMKSVNSENKENANQANQLLREGLLFFPSFLMRLLDKVSVEPDNDVKKSGLFNTMTDSPCLDLLISIYIQRSYTIWSDRRVVFWLETIVRNIVKEAHQFSEMNKSKYFSGEIPKNVLRHAILMKNRQTAAHIPPGLVDDKISAFDPFPPADTISSYEIKMNQSSVCNNDSSILGVFLKSWLPSFKAEETARSPESNDTEMSEGQTSTDLKQSISSLMSAMKNLLSNIENAQTDEEE